MNVYDLDVIAILLIHRNVEMSFEFNMTWFGRPSNSSKYNVSINNKTFVPCHNKLIT